MTRRDEIKSELHDLERRRDHLEKELLEREAEYRRYLMELTDADDADKSFRDEVLQWLAPVKSTKIKDWVIETIGTSVNPLTVADLRSRFRKEFGSKRVASLRQYLTERFGLVRKKGNKLTLTKKGRQIMLSRRKNGKRG